MTAQNENQKAPKSWEMPAAQEPTVLTKPEEEAAVLAATDKKKARTD